jgi:DNA polymerase-1
MAINAPIQGTQADLIKLAMVRITNLLQEEGMEKDAHLILQVHDELVFEIKDECLPTLVPNIKHLMESVLDAYETNGVPVLVEGKLGPDWGSMTPLG